MPTTAPGLDTTPAATPEPPVRPSRRWTRFTKIGVAVVATVALLETTAFVGTYVLRTSRYVSTDNAQVDGDKIEINAPADGVVTGWAIEQGSQVTTRQVVGRIKLRGAGAQPQVVVRAPGRGTVAVNDVVNNQWVARGTPLATAYDFDDIYVTARVPEDDIGEVIPGAAVEIAVDAFPGVPMTGVVTDVQSSTAGQLDIYPSADVDPTNPQRVDQWIPVRIALTSTGDAQVVPGMSVTVHIDKP